MRIRLYLYIIPFLFLWFEDYAQQNTSRPNIIFIIGDDISWNDIGCYGNQAIRTPHLDHLARTGLRFTNAYLTTSSCSPSRTSILTGRYPHNTGAAELHTPLPAHLTYFPELLKKQGYYTALVGKWHEGETTKRAYDTLFLTQRNNGEGGEKQWINLLKARPKDQPFFLWLAPYDAHRSWSEEDQFTKPYQPEEVIVPPTLADTWETRKDLASYYNEITRIDTHVGKLQEELKKQGIAKNTLIIFMADNGRAFPGSKTRLYDRGIKTPFIVYWPGGIKEPGEVCDALISSIDVAPTLLEAASVEVPKSIQGKSFMQLLSKPSAPFRNYVFAEHNWHDYEAYERAVRTKDFLYIINQRPQFDNSGPADANRSPSTKSLRKLHQEGKLSPLQREVFITPRAKEEFYDLRKDKLQASNVIDDPEYRVEVSKLRATLAQWQKETGDSLPEKLTADWFDRKTGKPLPGKGKRGEMPGDSNHADQINHPGIF